MRTLTRFAFTMSVILLSTAGLSGCNSSPSQVAPPSLNGATARGHGPPSAAAHGLRTGHHRSGTSWIRTPLTDRDLLYISDAASDVVNVFGYPSRTPVGQLFGFNEPQGECADSRGNVYVTNTGTSQIYVYPPASGTLLETINDPGEYPVGCAVGPEGDLAVTNIFSASYGPGSISLYNGSNTIPTIITSPSFERMYFDGFDANNNLFVDGLNASGVFQLGKLPSGSNTITPITVSGASISYPGGVQVTAGPKVNVGDQLGNVVYRMSEGGVVNGHTSLSGASDCVQGTIVVGKPVSKGVYICPDAGTADTEFFKYTAGGSPTQTITGFEQPIGSVISAKPPPPNPPAEIFNLPEVPVHVRVARLSNRFRNCLHWEHYRAHSFHRAAVRSVQSILSANPGPEQSVSADRDVRCDVEQNDRRIRARRSTRTRTTVTVLAVSRAFIMASYLPKIRLRDCGVSRKPLTGRTAVLCGVDMRSRRPTRRRNPRRLSALPRSSR